jgi:phage N-6-adenine-methyltransferase
MRCVMPRQLRHEGLRPLGPMAISEGMPPVQKPGRSEQVVQTPADFMAAVVRRFGPMSYDLAASKENAKAPAWLDEQTDSLATNWGGLRGNCWLNPPFAGIGLWAEKCARTVGPAIFLLVPASVGSNWYADWVERQAEVHFLNPRLTFVGHDHAFPKDLMLCVYGLGCGSPKVWRWR